MPISIHKEADGRIVVLKASGKLTAEDAEDYETFLPDVEHDIRRHDRVRILLELDDFHGWELAAGWEDLKFGLRHYRDLERLAIIGDRTWERVMASVFKPFTQGEVRYFDQSESNAAHEWIAEAVGGKIPL